MRTDPLVVLGRVLTWMIGVASLTLIMASGAATRLDNTFYDLHMRHWSYRTSDAVVIVAVDAKSLSRLGNWPWPRAVHARLLDRLTDAGVRGVGIDITMAEPDINHPENDRAFAQAIRRNGHVAMPVFAEAAELGGTLEEMLPTQEIASEASAFGHVDAAKDDDGVIRGAYLKAGLGRPYWPALALAVYGMDRKTQKPVLPSLHRPDTDMESPYQWMRDDYVLLHFAGPAGSFDQVSYVDLLEGHVSPALLNGRWVFVGATASGLGDLLDTSASGGEERMPGVEYQANLLESIENASTLTPLNFTNQLVIGATLLTLPLLLYGLPGFRQMWTIALVALLACFGTSIALLRMEGWWWPPLACVMVMTAGLGGFSALRKLKDRHNASR
ncbi:CHASE2 domain-containing sensor protein [Luteibacter jiangsuensis]|uniref:CHASE2 domain-containing sensor protein n=1 Tax=Luteibacter jiangsuensis TaxID=637577 RepID=A0ABT9STC0_9GAMM|nr:CHASE2 domain-containing protein [Luteibacter jiangsuensis]MDQ0008248.1 CHASE2 domain-containing sensor protein [Luteibacter jiangsuensis]